ncbi:hypothetical protein FRC07_000933 [Ceratobasidium sp. 392]|nr:hypothetical protein FRC07_000933 [Ceratobasidium sp. 392]
MQNYAVAHGAPKGPRRDGPAEDGFLPPLPSLEAIPSQLSATSIHPSGSFMSTNTGTGSMSHSHPSSSNNTPPSQTHPPPQPQQQQQTPSSYPQPQATPSYPHAQAYGPTQVFPPIQPQPAPTFGVPLAVQVARDGVEHPRILAKCTAAIEKHGLDSVGIYRVNGTTSRVQKLKGLLDRDVASVDLDSEEWASDINNVASVLKLWFRELPEPLMTWELYGSFVEAALAPSFETVAYNFGVGSVALRPRRGEMKMMRTESLMGVGGGGQGQDKAADSRDSGSGTDSIRTAPLQRSRASAYEASDCTNTVSEREHVNQMSRSNLAIVFGPTLLGRREGDEALGATVQDMSWQCKAIETILDNVHIVLTVGVWAGGCQRSAYVSDKRRGTATDDDDRDEMARRSADRERTDEDGYWDAISSTDDDDSAHLFWVPAHLHPEIAPSEFRAFLKEHARAADPDNTTENNASSSSSAPESTPFPGPARALSNSGLGRKKSMLSRQYRPSADDTDDEPQPVRRSRSSIYGGPQLTIGDLQKIDELAQDADPAKLRAVLRRSLSLNVAPSFLDKADALPDTTDEADSPIIVPRPGQILRRAARTKIRKPNLPGDGGGHRFPSTRRATRSTSANAVQSGTSTSDEHKSESDHTTESLPDSTQQHASPPVPQSESILVPPHAFEEDDWHSDRPLSYTDESTIFDAYADRRDSMTSVASDEERAAGLVPVVPATLDELIAIPPVISPHAPEPQTQNQYEPEREPEPEPEPEREPQLHHPAPQRHLAVPAEPGPQQRTPSPARSHSASPASSEQHLPTHGHAPSAHQPARKEKKGGLFGMGKKGKKDKDGEKDSGFFGSLFGGGRSKKADDSASSGGAGGGGFHGAGPAAAAALLGASKSKSPAPQTQSPGPPVQPSANGTYARYPIHVERAVYRLSHIKLANPRRPLYEQVLISNLMFWYLGVINRAQQEEKERQAEKEAAEREKKEKRSLTKNTGGDNRGSGGGQGPGGGGRRAEMPVRGPQYEMQNRQMAEEYTPQLSRSASAPPERQYHLPNRQQRSQSGTDEQFGYNPSMNGNGSGGLPPGAMAPQSRPSSGGGQSQQFAVGAETGQYGPYPPMNRPKSAGKGSSGQQSVGGSLGRRPRTAEGSTGEDDVPLDRLGGSLGRRAR